MTLLLSTSVRAESREISISGDYLYLPISSGARARHLSLAVAGKTLLAMPIEAADGAPGWYTSVRVSDWKGKTLQVSVEGLPAGSQFFEHVLQGDSRLKELPGGPATYAEALRPLFHFTAARGWINDPNAPIFHGGQFHLFFQLDPSGYYDHTKFWGYATSTDLVHWSEKDAALAPGPEGAIWSGSGVTDWNNTSGLGIGGKPPLVMFYTAAGDPFTQCMAYSTDGGKTFTKRPTPVVPNIRTDNRDPRVIWHEPTRKWVMALWVRMAGAEGKPGDGAEGGNGGERNTIQFLTSPNLKEWTRVSENEGFFECPDLIHLPSASQSDRYVLTAASGAYQVGTFDGTVFKPSTPMLESTRTGVFYAAQTFTELPKGDGRTLQIGWMRDTVSPGMPFNQCLTVIHELALLDTPDGPRLTRTPHRELVALRAGSTSHSGRTFQPGEYFLGDLSSEGVELRLDFAPAPTTRLEINLRGIPISYDAAKQELAIAGTRTPAPLQNGRQRMVVLLDRTSLEAFASDGLVYLPLALRPEKAQRALHLSVNTELNFTGFEVHGMGSMWAPQPSAR